MSKPSFLQFKQVLEEIDNLIDPQEITRKNNNKKVLKDLEEGR